MKRTDPYMPLYIGDYLADTMHLTGPMHGAYLLLIMHHWRRGPLPADDLALATIARTEIADWHSTIRDSVMAFFQLEDGHYIHYGVTARKADSEQKHAIASANGSKGAQTRWGSIARPSVSHCQTDNNHNQIHNQDKKEIEPNGSTKKDRAKATRLPRDWQPSQADRDYAVARGLNPVLTAEDFRGYWCAKAGSAATKVDWSLTWQGWCRRDAERRGIRQPLQPGDEPPPPPKFL